MELDGDILLGKGSLIDRPQIAQIVVDLLGRALRLEVEAVETVARYAENALVIVADRPVDLPEIERHIEVILLHQLALVVLHLRHHNLAAQQLHALQDILGPCGLKLLEVVLDDLRHPLQVSALGRTKHSAIVQLSRVAERTGREFREIPADPVTGGIEVDEVLKHVDENTVLVSVMAASNISGNIMDIKEISRRVHEINPDIYVISDAVQHAPHCVIDVEDWNVDVCNFAPYKFFGVRGCGFAYVSHRVANMFHARLLFKAPDVWALGTPAPGNFAAMMAVIDYVCSIGRHFSPSTYGSRELFVEGMNRIHLQERALLHRMLETMAQE